MKFSRIRNLLVAFGVFFLATIPLQAADFGDALSIEKTQEGKYIRVYNNEITTSLLTIKIKDAAGVILLEEEIMASNQLAKLYNLERLPEGAYQLEISDFLNQVVQPFAITVNGIELDRDVRQKSFKPYVRMSEKNLDINLLLTADTRVDVELFSEKYEQVYTGSFTDFGRTFNKRLNVAQLEKGRYLLKVKYNEEVFFQTVMIK